MSQKIAVIGSGLIGRAWAIAFARSGYSVALHDMAPQAADAALAFIDGVLRELADQDLLGGASPDAVRRNIMAVGHLSGALENVVHIQECTPEDLESKISVFKQLDSLAPAQSVIASSTSALLPSKFTKGLPGADRCLVAHPVNPPYLIPAVEIVPAPWTDASVVKRTALLMESIGQATIVMKQEIDGFVVNRLQGALLQEAFRLVKGGYAGVNDVDIAVSEGLGLRWSFMGPFETIDLNAPGGIADYVARYEDLYRNLSQTQQEIVSWADAVSTGVEAERATALPRSGLRDRQAWRDRRLMGLIAHKRGATKLLGK